MDQLDLKLQNR